MNGSKEGVMECAAKWLMEFDMTHQDLKELLAMMDYGGGEVTPPEGIALGYWSITDCDEMLDTMCIELSDDDIEDVLRIFEEDFLMGEKAWRKLRELLIKRHDGRRSAKVCGTCGTILKRSDGKCSLGHDNWVRAVDFLDWERNKTWLHDCAENLCISIDDLAYRVEFLKKPGRLEFETVTITQIKRPED